MTSRLVVDTIQASTLGGNMVTIPTGQKLYAPGHVIQVVQNFTNTQVSLATTTYTNTGLSASINPSSANSKILVIVNQSVRPGSTGVAYAGGGVRLVRTSGAVDTTIVDSVADGTGPYGVWWSGPTAGIVYATLHTINYLDSPGTVNTLTYRTQGRSYNSSVSYMNFNISDTGGSSGSTMLLLEIGG